MARPRIRLCRPAGALALKISGAFAVKELGFESKVTAAPKPILQNNTYVAFGKSSNSETLVAKFNKALSELKKSGKYDEIYDDFVNKN